MRLVKSQLAHCLALFDVMSDARRDHRLTDLAHRLDMPKSSVQRLLDHLTTEGWIEQETTTEQYRLTLRLAALGQRYMQTAGIADATQGVLDMVARETGELARLTVVDRDRLVWIGSAQGAKSGLIYQPSMGAEIIAHATANGKVWLATLSDEQACAIALAEGMGKRNARVGPRAINTIDGLRAELAKVRKQGFATVDEEAEVGVAAIAVAIRDAQTGVALGTTSIAGPRVRLRAEYATRMAAIIMTAALELARVWPLGRVGGTSEQATQARGGR